MRNSLEKNSITNSKPSAINIKGLTKQYNHLIALKKINLDIHQGEFFGLLGPNGAGKSTTINIVSGLCNKTSGKVQIFGLDLVSDYRKCRDEVGLVPQEFNFDPFSKLLDMLVFQGGFFGIPTRECILRSNSLLKEFNLTEKSQTQLRHLSGGMKRRAMIIRALVHQPRLLILDEPTAGVDVELRKSLWEFLRKLNTKGTTILLTTHYLEEAESLCNRIAIIDQGKIIANDATKNLVNKLHEESVIITATSKINKNILARFSKYKPVLNKDSDELTLSFVKANTDFNTMLRDLLKSEICVANIRPVKNRLEQVFLQLTKRDVKA